jgi:nucleotide-binding universal stress UspA family protein
MGRLNSGSTMLPIHTILHPHDFSEHADAAFSLACSLARDYHARLVLLHVVPPTFFGGEVHALITNTNEIHKELQERLDGLHPRRNLEQKIHIDRLLRDGDVTKVILSMAKEVSADLIVMGTHGQTFLRHLLMGPVAESIMRKAPCPVLTIKKPIPEEDDGEE